MIKNQKQASVSRKRLAELTQSLTELNAKQLELSSAEYRLGLNSLEYLIDDVKRDIHEYESLISGDIHCFEPQGLSDINKILISTRIVKRVSHKELGELLGIQEQQIQRYEASDYESATWTRIQEIAYALGLKFEFKKITLATERRQFKIPPNINHESIQRAKNTIKSYGLNFQAA